MKVKFILLSLLFILMPVLTVAAKEKPILKYFPIDSSSEVSQNNQVLAREQAIKNALANILESVIGQILKPEIIAENYLFLKNNIYPKGENYIQGYKVISEKYDPREKIYKVSLNVNIFVSDLRNHLNSLGLLSAGKKDSFALVIIEEKNSDDPDEFFENYSFAETLITDKLHEIGISANDREILHGVINYKEFNLLKKNDAALISFLRIQTDTDILILGELNFFKKTIPIFGPMPENNIEEFEMTAEFALEIINTKTKEIVASKNNQISLSGNDEELIQSLLIIEMNENVFDFLLEEIKKIIP